MDTIGKRLKWARERRGWSLSKLAKEAKMSRSFIWEVERSRSGITIEKLSDLASALNVSVLFLVSGENAPVEYQPNKAIQLPHELLVVGCEDNLTVPEMMRLWKIYQLCRGVMDVPAWKQLWETVRGE